MGKWSTRNEWDFEDFRRKRRRKLQAGKWDKYDELEYLKLLRHRLRLRGWTQSDKWYFEELQRTRSRLKNEDKWSNLREMEYQALLDMKLSRAESDAHRDSIREQLREEKRRKEREQDRLRQALAEQRKALRKKMIRNNWDGFFKKVKKPVLTSVTKLLNSNKTKQLSKEVQAAIHTVYGVSIDVDLSKQAMKSKNYWAESSLNLLMPDSRSAGDGLIFGGTERVAFFGAIGNWYRKRKATREYQLMYKHFEDLIRPAVAAWSKWYVSKLEELSTSLQRAANKAYGKKQIKIRENLKGAQARSVVSSIMALIETTVPDAVFTDEGNLRLST